MNYVYQFRNYYKEIIYIGKTKDIKKRMCQHFSTTETGYTGHLPDSCYSQVAEVYYAETGISKYDTEVIETLLINQYKPIYNTDKRYTEPSDRTNYTIPKLNWKRIYIDQEISLKKPHLEVYNTYKSDTERILAIIKYNIYRLKYKKGFYEYYLGPEFNDNMLDELASFYESCISSISFEYSDIDEPISISENEFTTYAAICVNKINLSINYGNLKIFEKLGLIFWITQSVYGIPLHTPENMKVINKRM